MNDNRMPIITGLGAAVFCAENDLYDEYGPNPYKYDPRPRVYWEDATEEQRKDPNIHWQTTMAILGNKQRMYFIRKPTEEEKQVYRLAQKWRLEHMFDYIFKYYGWQMAFKFYQDSDWSKDFKKYNCNINLKIPFCQSESEEGQCDFRCYYFQEGECKWKSLQKV